MLCDLVLLRRNGLKLRRSELSPAVRGELAVYGGAGPQTSFRREILQAALWAPSGANNTTSQGLAPLFDVRVLAITGQTLTLIGIELESTGSVSAGTHLTIECVQIWRSILVLPEPAAQQSIPPKVGVRLPAAGPRLPAQPTFWVHR